MVKAMEIWKHFTTSRPIRRGEKRSSRHVGIILNPFLEGNPHLLALWRNGSPHDLGHLRGLEFIQTHTEEGELVAHLHIGELEPPAYRAFLRLSLKVIGRVLPDQARLLLPNFNQDSYRGRRWNPFHSRNSNGLLIVSTKMLLMF